MFPRGNKDYGHNGIIIIFVIIQLKHNQIHVQKTNNYNIVGENKNDKGQEDTQFKYLEIGTSLRLTKTILNQLGK